MIRPMSAMMALAAALSTSQAFAAPFVPTAANTLREFGAVIRGSLNGDSDFEGPSIIGGNLNAQASLFGKGITANSTNSLGTSAMNPGLPDGFGTMNVYGNASGQFNANPVNGTKQIIYIAGTNTGAFGQQNNQVVLNNPWTPSVTLAAIFDPLAQLSTDLTTFSNTANSTILLNGSNATFNATPTTVNGVAGVSVFNVTAAQLLNYTNIAVSTNGASTVVVNVTGNFNQNQGVNFNHSGPNNSDRQNVIWNFYDATNLFFTQWQGAVLAPLAAVSNSSPIEGTLVAASANKHGEYHYNPFVGTLAFLEATPVPEPASLTILGLGLAGVAFARRRRA